MRSRTFQRKGVVALITVIIIALFLFSIGILVGVQGNTTISSNQYSSEADNAEALAQTGIQDALIKLARNASTSGTYTLNETAGTVTILVTGAGLSATSTVDATGTVQIGLSTVQRAKHADVNIDADGTITKVTEKDL